MDLVPFSVSGNSLNALRLWQYKANWVCINASTYLVTFIMCIMNEGRTTLLLEKSLLYLN